MSITNNFARIIGALMNESLADMIRLESMEDDKTLVLKDGSLMSMIQLEGALRTPGQDEVADMVERLRIALSPYLSNPGHVITFNFIRDPDAARRDVADLVNRTGRGARSLGLDIEDVLGERERVLSRRMVSETCLVTIFSRPDVMSGEEADEARKKISTGMKAAPVLAHAHSFNKVMDAVFTRHQALTEAVNRSFRIVGQLSRILDVTETLQEVRAALYPSTSPQKTEWTPRLPRWNEAAPKGAEFVMMPETDPQVRGTDFSHLFNPSFDHQLATEDCFVENSRTVRIGDRIFSAFDMTLAPETLPDFDELVMDVTSKSNNVPWRASLQIESGGMHSQALKSTFLSIFTFANPVHNRRIRDAINALREIDGQMDTVVKFRMSFATWAPVNKADDLRRNAQILNGAVQRWGNSRADGVSGDQLATTLASVPGVTMASTAPVAAAPLSHALAMGPIARQASPWKFGSVLFRTDDGKTWPYQPNSSKQATWVTLLVGTPGSGKSVMMNAINFASAISPSIAGGKDPVLPRIAIIDIGPSSSGMISLVKEALPANRRHEVLFRKLRMSREDAVNVFDTQLGMREPTANERTFLINFLTLICGDGTKPPSVAMRGLITACIDRVYEDLKDDKSPRRYLREDEPDVDRALDKIGFDAHGETVWWEVVDTLMENGMLFEASIAQRHAVPTIADLVTASQADQVSSLYASARDSETDQPIMNAFQRMISEVVRDFPILSTYTKFSIGSSRIVSLDLMDVTASGGGPTARRQTAIMYMLARQILTRDFFLDEAEFRSKVNLGVMPDIYLAYHVDRARENLQLPKILCMDEFHRTGKIEMVCDQVLQDAREGRKFNVDIKIASQLIEDFPPSIVEIVSSLIVCNAGSENSITYFDKMYGLSESEKYAIRNHLTGPSSRGAPVWAMFRMKDEGVVRQRLILTLGPAEIWAFSTTAEDVVLRSRLYEQIGPRLTRQVLARRFPGGSAKSDIEARVAQMEEQGKRVGDNERGDVLGALVEDLKKQAFLLGDV
jgi:intracellular multiplication protein IcmB